MIKVLTFSSLYPNAEFPNHGVFVENRLRRVVETGKIAATVVSPVGFFPFKGNMFGTYGALARVPDREERHGVPVYHPRHLIIPKVGMNLAAQLMYAGVKGFVRRLFNEEGGFDVLDAHYFYPDGVVAARLSKDLNLPVVITARGSDLSELTEYPGPRSQILWAAENAHHMVTVCQALKDKLLDLGIQDNRVSVFRNGVDLDAFQPQPHEASRQALGVSTPLFVSVGHLIPRKGHDLVIKALADLPGVSLMIVGSGPEQSHLEQLVQDLKIGDRVRFMGQIPHKDLPKVYSAADALVLASSREGWANVLLEAMACGTPAIATDVWGTREVVQTPAAGLLVADRTPEAIKSAMTALLAAPPDRNDTRRYAEGFDWSETTQNQINLFASLKQKCA